MHLTKYEQETIVNWNRSDNEASIYTFEPDLKRRLAKFAKEYPECCKLERSSQYGDVTYAIDKRRISIRLTAPYSEERRKASSTRAKKHGLNAQG